MSPIDCERQSDNSVLPGSLVEQKQMDELMDGQLITTWTLHTFLPVMLVLGLED